MAAKPLVMSAPEWTVALEIRPRLWAMLHAEARHSGRTVDQILTEVLGDFLRANPLSLR